MTKNSLFPLFEAKMRQASLGDAVIANFRSSYENLCKNQTTTISDTSILPVRDLPKSIEFTKPADSSKMREVVVIKLNGGLGTSMGLQGPKSLLPIREGKNFLDLMVQQILDTRALYQSNTRLLLMNSFSTSASTIAYMQRYAEHGLASPDDVQLMQNQIPKIDANTYEPVSWSKQPELEWCPPGHGDIYPALLESGWLERLLKEGVKYAFVSNSDNLGALLDPYLLEYFASSEAPFLMEVTKRTSADRKGGHLAKRKSDGRLLLRELAQCLDEDLESFQDINKYSYFNTNNIWLRLDLLLEKLKASNGSMELPTIQNYKTVDPRDKASTKVIQLESAMGAAIESFDQVAVIEVPRTRFAPVKTTSDLLALRSDAYNILPNGQIVLDESRKGVPPTISLSDHYKMVDQLDELGLPSLLNCRSLQVNVPCTFNSNMKIEGDVVINSKEDLLVL